jgi:predicted Fe-S protein YdhL (DUF1289 family)
MRGHDLDKSAKLSPDLSLAESEETIALQYAMVLVAERARLVRATGEFISPCISVCRIGEASGLCLGCFRTRDEIARWSTAGDAEKRSVWRMIERRMAALATGPAE